jgi:hypothetical protein
MQITVFKSEHMGMDDMPGNILLTPAHATWGIAAQATTMVAQLSQEQLEIIILKKMTEWCLHIWIQRNLDAGTTLLVVLNLLAMTHHPISCLVGHTAVKLAAG